MHDDPFDVTGVESVLVITIRRNNRMIQAYGNAVDVEDSRLGFPSPIANPLKVLAGAATEFQAGDLIDVYAFCSELGYVLVGSTTVADPEQRIALAPVCDFPTKGDGTSYNWKSAAYLVLLKVYNLGRYAGSFAGHSYTNIFSTTLPATSPLVLTMGEDVYYIGDPSGTNPPSCTPITVFSTEYNSASYSWETSGHTYGITAPETVTATCTGATSLVSANAPHSNYALPITIPHTVTAGVVSMDVCAYEPRPVLTFERNSRRITCVCEAVNNSFTFMTGTFTLVGAADVAFECEGGDLITTGDDPLTHVVSGYVGDIVTYTYGSSEGSFIIGETNEVVDLRSGTVVSYKIFSDLGTLVSSTHGEIIRHPGSEPFDMLDISCEPGVTISVTCQVDGQTFVREVVVPEGGGELDWRGLDAPAVEDPPEDPFTPEARLVKIHAVNNGDAGDIVIKVTKPTTLVTTEVVTLTPGLGETDYFFDVDTYGLPGIWLSKRFHAEIELPGGAQTIDIPWPDASMQLNVIYGTPDPTGGTGSALGFIVVVNHSNADATLHVRTNHILGTMDTVGTVEAYSTRSFPILETYLNPLDPDIIRCKVAGSKGVLERDFVYPQSHIVDVDYGASALQNGSFDFKKYGLIIGGAIVIIGTLMILLKKL